MPHCSSMSMGTPFFISKLKFWYDKYSVEFIHFYFGGITLSSLIFLPDISVAGGRE